MKPQQIFQAIVFLGVFFNTVAAVQVVQAKLVAKSQNSTYWDTTFSRNVNPAVPTAEFAPSASAFIPTAFPTVSPALSSTRQDPLTAERVQVATTAFQGPGSVVVPILMYHRIDVSPTDSQYYVSPEKFDAQLKLLRDWGYTTITVDMLAKSISNGADLPLHPIIITFDDGHLNNYTTALPIMQKYGFTGVLYVMGEYMGTPGYMNASQIKEMARAGWEVGSHSMTHPDLTMLDLQQQQYEIVESRRFLEAELGTPILTFAYPFGEYNMSVVNMVYSAGYVAGMGLGYTNEQTSLNLYTLQRRGVNGTHDLNSFASTLPWQGDLAYLQAESPVLSSAPDVNNTQP